MFAILYVDDEPFLLELGKLFLERSRNLTVDTAVSAAEAITKLQSQHYDGIISDYQMPDMDGIAFLKYVRARYEYLPFILFTGRGREEVVIDAINNGADFYIQKGGDPTSQFAEVEHKITMAIDKQQVECQLEESRKRLDNLINFLPDATFAIDLERKVIIWNRSMEEMTGVKNEDILGTADYSYAIPFYGERRPVLIDLVLREDKETEKKYPRIVKQDDKLISENFIPMLKGGNGAFISFTAAPLYDSKGHVAGAIESVRDITELRQMESALRNTEDQYRTLFENTGTATVLIEENTVISLANEEFERFSGYPKEEIEGKKSWTEFVMKDDLDRMLAQHRLRRERQETALKHYEFRFVTKSGNVRNIFLSIDMIPGTKKSVASLMDITERKRAEEAMEQKNTELHAAYEQLTATEEELRQNYDELSKKEQALCESEEKYRTIFENAGDAIAIHDLEGHFVEVNDVICRRFGYTREELLKMRVGDVDDPVHAREVGKRIVELSKKGHAIFETVHITRDGRQIPAEVSAVFFHLGKKPLVMSIARDITERKQAEEQLRQFAEELDQIFQTAADGMRVVDRDFNVLRMNETFLTLAGIRREDAAGRKCYEVFPGPRCHTPGCPLARILGGEGHVVDEVDKIAAGGKKIPCIVTATPFRHPDSEVIGIVEDFRDLTERKRAEEILQESEERYRDIFDNARDLIQLVASDGRILYVNPAWRETLGYSEKEIAGLSAFDIIHPDKVERSREIFRRVMSGENVGVIETTLVSKDGREIIVERSCTSKFVNGEPVYCRCISHDITKQKRAEEMLIKKHEDLEAACEEITTTEEELRQNYDELSKKEQIVRESENNLKAILESLQSALVIIDSKTHTIVDANSVAVRMIGAPREEIIGHVCHKYICPADVGKCPISDLKQTIDLSERILLTAKGEQVPILKSVTPKVISGHEYYIENLIDITERKQMEEQLHDTGKRKTCTSL
jgi:PAS domain S-box-containing protein